MQHYLKTGPSHQIEKEEGLVQNNAGGYVYQITPWSYLKRFLVLGSETATFYQAKNNVIKQNLTNVDICIKEDGCRVVDTLLEYKDRVVKVDPILAVLAKCAKQGNIKTREKAYQAVTILCKTATHLFQWMEMVRTIGGRGTGFKKAVRRWYQLKPAKTLAYQMVKYRNRAGYTHRDALRLTKPVPIDSEHDFLYGWVTGKKSISSEVAGPKTVSRTFVEAFEAAQTTTDIKVLRDLITTHNLPWEALPTESLNSPDIWNALLPSMGITAMVRNLGRMSAIGVFKPLSVGERIIVEKLKDAETIEKSGVHPLFMLQALKVYQSGRGILGDKTWDANSNVVAALESAFYMSFKNVKATGKRYLIGLDVSGSMAAPATANSILSSAEVASAFGMTIMRTEQQCHIFGFCNEFVDLKLNRNMSLDQVLKNTYHSNFGSTDCAVPMTYAKKHNIDCDVFIVITDNETWAGKIKPVQALNDYNKGRKEPAKLIVLATSTTPFSIADPNSPHMLDIPGFDSGLVPVINEFIERGF